MQLDQLRFAIELYLQQSRLGAFAFVESLIERRAQI